MSELTCPDTPDGKHRWRWDRSRCEKCIMELSDYVAALEAEVERLKTDHGMNILAGEIADLRDEVRRLKSYEALANAGAKAQENLRQANSHS